MTTKNLGRLQKVKLREAWEDEAGDFTPWLAQKDNLKLLGEAIGIDLEPESQEKHVGPFRADILCKDLVTDNWVLIENQLERTDHSHLGQLLTYAAGLNAVTIVWIAERFTEEHRAALDWLNEKTEEGIHFFGLEVELWKIGESEPAPKFNVVCKPNDWTKRVAETVRDTKSSDLRWRYWSEFIKRPELQAIVTQPLRAWRSSNLVLSTKWRNLKLSAFISQANDRIGVYARCRGAFAGDCFQGLLAQRSIIEKELGKTLVWDGAEDRRWITLRLPGNDVSNEQNWPRQHELLAQQAVAFYKALDPHVRELGGESTTVK